ncbi:MAG TPA: HRDC domain-containing protein [Kofleriaceae bacterium]|nr:HRDC domain-containing protein [Kofleriaceae bacterium]
MTGDDTARLVVDDAARVADIAGEIARTGAFAFDLEFVSEDRYVPELALLQLAWGDPAAPLLALVDPLAVDATPLLALVADPAIEVVAHAARQDLGLLATVHGLTASRLIDTQIASAFAGLADQIGYARMVQKLFGVTIDKGHQHTDWKRRPLSDAQLRYALDDVRHVLAAWRDLGARLAPLGRVDWVREESDRLARGAAQRRAPDDAYRAVGGWAALRPAPLAALRELAAWREREALGSNTPPSWIATDPVLLEIARRAPANLRDLGRVRGVQSGLVRKHGEAVLAALGRAAGQTLAVDAPPPLAGRGQAQAAMVAAIVQARASEADVPARMVAARADAEALVAAFEATGAGAGPLAEGWRHELAGRDALAWLRGEVALAADPDAAGGVRLLPLATRRT